MELVRRGHDAFNRRDLDAYLATHDADIEFTPYERAIEGLGPYHGHEDVRQWWRNAFEVFPDFNVELDEVRDIVTAVVVRGRLHGHGAESGASFERTYWGVFRLRNEKVVWWHAF